MGLSYLFRSVWQAALRSYGLRIDSFAFCERPSSSEEYKGKGRQKTVFLLGSCIGFEGDDEVIGVGVHCLMVVLLLGWP